MIQLVMVLLLAFVVAVTGFVWQTVWGFHPLEPSNWQWLVDYALAYHQLPPFVLGSLFAATGAFFALAGLVILVVTRIGSRNVHGKRDKESLHGSAQWATRADVVAADLLRPTGAVVGGWPSIFGTKTLRHDGPEHIMAFAPTRSGKGVGLVLPTLLSWPASALVLDIKGENWRLTSGWRASIGQRILKFDPTAETGSIRFNPLAEIRLGTDYEIADAQNIAAMIIDPEGKGLRDFWMKSGFAWLTAGILHFLYRMRLEEGRCASLRDVGLSMSAPGDGIETMLKAMLAFDHRHDGRERAAVDKLVHAAAQEMLDRAGNERSGVHSSALTELALYRDPIIAANIEESDFRLDDLMNGERPASLYLVVPPSDIDRLRPLLRVVLNLFMRRLMQNVGANGKAAYKHRLLVLLDEFTSIGKLEIFDRSLGFMGGYGLKAFLIVQDLAQIQGTYGRENGIVGNCHIQIAYAPNDIATAKVLSDKCGVTTVVQRHRDRNRRALQLLGNVTDRLNEVSRPLLTADECMRLKGAKKSRRDPSKIVRAGDMLVFVSGRPPILGRQPLYFQNKTLLARSLLSPAGETHAGGRDDDAGKNLAQSGPAIRAGDAVRMAAGSVPAASLPSPHH
jgi:type IV secretion system protein VirD4